MIFLGKYPLLVNIPVHGTFLATTIGALRALSFLSFSLTMISRRLGRTYIIIVAAFFALLVLYFLPQTGIHERSKKLVNSIIQGDGDKAPEDTGFNDDRWFFQEPLEGYEQPRFTQEHLDAAPQNYYGPGHDTIATIFTTRNGKLNDPYFMAAQQIVYRVLWNPRSKTTKIPMTVFVTSYVSQEQRNFFVGAGAIVRELPLRPFVPDHPGTSGRLKDMFSKLEMWYQLEFSRIAYLDSDAFPVDHIDSIFEEIPWQRCKKELLPEEDSTVAKEICTYSFGGWMDFNGINAGVMVLSPNAAMYGRLIRESLNHSTFDNGFMEQALLAHAYDREGPFPPTEVDHEWNAGPDMTKEGEHQYIVHDKLWATGFSDADAWHRNEFKHMWSDMIDFYKSEQFSDARKESGPITAWDWEKHIND